MLFHFLSYILDKHGVGVRNAVSEVSGVFFELEGVVEGQTVVSLSSSILSHEISPYFRLSVFDISS